MRRREFITLLGSVAATRPMVARAQQAQMPVIGFVNSNSPQSYVRQLSAFLKGLGEAGYVEGRNVAIEYRWADGENDRLPAMVADLVRRPVTVIAAAGGNQAVLAAKASTATIPIVFSTGSDPVQQGLVASINRPGGNLTGVTQFTASLESKRLELLRELVPNVALIAIVVDPNYPDADAQVNDVQTAARTLGQRIVILKARNVSEIETAFATLVQQGAGALLVASDPFFTGQRDRLVALAAQHALPTIYQWREYAAIGGLMSYGTDITNSYHQLGIYVARVLKGEKPSDLPVVQSTKVDLVINLKTAKVLGLKFPLSLLGRADEVIE